MPGFLFFAIAIVAQNPSTTITVLDEHAHHVPQGTAVYAVDGSGRVIASGTTDNNGQATIGLPGPVEAFQVQAMTGGNASTAPIFSDALSVNWTLDATQTRQLVLNSARSAGDIRGSVPCCCPAPCDCCGCRYDPCGGCQYTGEYRAGFAESVVSSAPETGDAVISLSVPTEAKVFINGLPTQTTGSNRQYVSHCLEVGKSYTYEISVQAVRGGKTFEIKRGLVVRAGEVTSFATAMPPATASGIAKM